MAGETALPAGQGCLARLKGLSGSLQPSQRRVAEYILAHPEHATLLTVTELASRSSTSESTVVKLAQRLGFRGFGYLKIALAGEIAQVPGPVGRQVYGDVSAADPLPVAKEKIFHSNLEAVRQTLSILQDAELERAVAAVSRARQLHLYGVGASGFVALDAEHKFTRIGLCARSYVDPHLQAAFAALLGAGDVAVGISHSGRTRDVIDAVRIARDAGATTVAITNGIDSPLDRLVDVRLHTASQEGPLRSGAVASRIAQLCVIDALFVGVAIRNFEQAQDFLARTRKAVQPKKTALRPPGRKGVSP